MLIKEFSKLNALTKYAQRVVSINIGKIELFLGKLRL